MNSHNRELEFYRREIAQRIIFGSLGTKSIRKIRVRRRNKVGMLSENYIRRDATHPVEIMAWIFAGLSVLVILFMLTLYGRADVLTQVGILVVAIAFMLIYIGIAIWVCEKTIRDEDIVVVVKPKPIK